jgi:hypothetical protein
MAFSMRLLTMAAAGAVIAVSTGGIRCGKD